MRVTRDKLEISTSQSILWEDVKTLRMLNNKLALVLTDDQVVELTDVRPNTIDSAFRAYENYLKDHPEKRRTPSSRKKH